MIISFAISTLELKGTWDAAKKHLTLAQIGGRVTIGVKILGVPVAVRGMLVAEDQAIGIRAAGPLTHMLVRLLSLVRAILRRLRVEACVRGDGIYLAAGSFVPKSGGIEVTFIPAADDQISS